MFSRPFRFVGVVVLALQPAPLCAALEVTMVLHEAQSVLYDNLFYVERQRDKQKDRQQEELLRVVLFAWITWMDGMVH